jgi:hypothetical protein
MAERQYALRLACTIGAIGKQTVFWGGLSSKPSNNVGLFKAIKPRPSTPNLTAPYADAYSGGVDLLDHSAI